jgi:hypothetical protein
MVNREIEALPVSQGSKLCIKALLDQEIKELPKRRKKGE